MKKFWIRAISMAVIIASVFGYNMILSLREKEDEIAKLNSQLEFALVSGAENAGSLETDVDMVGSSLEACYIDGRYYGEAEGFGGTISVEVTIEGGTMTKIEILAAENEDGAYFSMAEDIIPAMLEAQSAEVDTISGATFSSTGIKNAVMKALEQAVSGNE